MAPEIVQIVMQLGGFGVVALLVWRFVDRIEPRLTAFLTALSAAVARIETKVDGLAPQHAAKVDLAVAQIGQRVSDVGSGVATAVDRVSQTGQQLAMTVSEAVDVITGRHQIDPDAVASLEEQPPLRPSRPRLPSRPR
jgi:hypothetical protein